MDTEMEMLKAELRALVGSTTDGITLHQLEQDYRDTNGVSIPYRKHGFSSLQNLLRDMGDKITIKKRGGVTILEARTDGSTAHLDWLIRTQRKAPTTRMGGSIPGLPRSGRRSRSAPASRRRRRSAPGSSWIQGDDVMSGLQPFKPQQQSSDCENTQTVEELGTAISTPGGTKNRSTSSEKHKQNSGAERTDTSSSRSDDACVVLRELLSAAPGQKLSLSDLTRQYMHKLRSNDRSRSSKPQTLDEKFFKENQHLFELTNEHSAGTFVSLGQTVSSIDADPNDTVALSLSSMLPSASGKTDKPRLVPEVWSEGDTVTSSSEPNTPPRRRPRSLPPYARRMAFFRTNCAQYERKPRHLRNLSDEIQEAPVSSPSTDQQTSTPCTKMVSNLDEAEVDVEVKDSLISYFIAKVNANNADIESMYLALKMLQIDKKRIDNEPVSVNSTLIQYRIDALQRLISTVKRHGGRCFVCKDSITGTFKELGKKLFHDGCLNCTNCKREQDELEVKIRHNKVYCRRCHSTLFGQLCDKCHAPIEPDQLIRAKLCDRQLRLHKQCYRCATCNTPMQGQQLENQGHIYCSAQCSLKNK